MTINTWIIIFSIIFLSGIVKGTTGFGFALFSVPLLVHFIPIKYLIPIVTLFNLFSSFQILVQSKNIKLKRSIILLSISGIIGVVMGSFILKFFPDRWLELMAAIVLIILSILFLTGYRFKIRHLKRGNVIAGLISGILGGSLAISGPPLALFLTSVETDKLRFRYIFAWFSVITASIALFDYIKIGYVNLFTFKVFAIALPIVIMSIIIGKKLSEIVSVKIFYKVVICITLISGILLFLKCCNVF